MKINLCNQDYFVDFKYGVDNDNKDVTVCLLCTPNKNKQDVYSQGIAIRSNKDVNNRIVARKVAFAKAISNMQKATRTEAWKQFKEQCKYRYQKRTAKAVMD